MFCNGAMVSFNKTPIEGVSWDKHFREFVAGQSSGLGATIFRKTPIPGQDRERTTSIQLLDPATLDKVRLEGWEAIYGDYNAIGTTPLTDLEEGKPLVLVEIDTGHHRVFDAFTGEIFPCAMVFNYIDGWMHNGNYDLIGAAKVLLERDDITLDPSGGQDQYSYSSNIDENDPRHWIGRIPGYNCEEGKTECLRFHWHPSIEDIRKVFALAKSWIHGGKDPQPSSWLVRRAIFELDMLGLQASETDTRRAERLLHAEDRNDD